MALTTQADAAPSNVFISGLAAKRIASAYADLRAQGRIADKLPDTASITVSETDSGYVVTIGGLGDGAVQYIGTRRGWQSTRTAAFSEVLGTTSLDSGASRALLTTLDFVQSHPAETSVMNAEYDSGDFIVGIHRGSGGTIFIGVSYPVSSVPNGFIGCIRAIRQFKVDESGAVTELRPACI